MSLKHKNIQYIYTNPILCSFNYFKEVCPWYRLIIEMFILTYKVKKQKNKIYCYVLHVYLDYSLSTQFYKLFVLFLSILLITLFIYCLEALFRCFLIISLHSWFLFIYHLISNLFITVYYCFGLRSFTSRL